MVSPRWVALGLMALLGAGCTDHARKIKEREAARAAEKKKLDDAAEAKRKVATQAVDPPDLEPFWVDPSYLRVATGRPCPEGLWALFPGTPGEGAVKEANEARRTELAAKMRQATFVAVMPFNTGVGLRAYNKKKKKMTIEVEGLIECFDGLGLLSLAWGEPAKAYRPRPEDEDEQSVLSPQAVWRARPLLFPLPFGSAAEAQGFVERRGPSIEARLVFKLGKVAIDKKLQKTARPVVPDAGAVEDEIDWGAGRLVHVELLGVRIGANHEKDELAQTRNKP